MELTVPDALLFLVLGEDSLLPRALQLFTKVELVGLGLLLELILADSFHGLPEMNKHVFLIVDVKVFVAFALLFDWQIGLRGIQDGFDGTLGLERDHREALGAKARDELLSDLIGIGLRVHELDGV